MEFNVAINLFALRIIHNRFVVEASVAHARMARMTIWVHYLTFHMHLTIEIACRLRYFSDFRWVWNEKNILELNFSTDFTGARTAILTAFVFGTALSCHFLTNAAFRRPSEQFRTFDIGAIEIDVTV